MAFDREYRRTMGVGISHEECANVMECYRRDGMESRFRAPVRHHAEQLHAYRGDPNATFMTRDERLYRMGYLQYSETCLLPQPQSCAQPLALRTPASAPPASEPPPPYLPPPYSPPEGEGSLWPQQPP